MTTTVVSPALVIGARIGAYEVISPLGSGGMGEVYRARDSRLNREVALKVLPDALAADRDRVARLEREAQVLASLNHPGIAAIYGVEYANGAPVLVLELVEGVTLEERLARGPLPVEDGLAIARQLAVALEAAHEKGIIHRDLKPANVKLTDRAQVKVLDFGLAKMLESDAPSAPLAHSPTMSLRATEAGLILGTAAYMSPEQARGRPLDRRTDVWSFGCVLFEMLAGEAPFKGETASDVIAAVLKSEPEWTRLPAATPQAVGRLLRRCLVKDTAMRLRDMGDAQLEIGEALNGAVADVTTHASRGSRALAALLWPAIVVAVAFGAFALTRAYFAAPAPEAPVIHSTIAWPARPSGGNPAGRMVLSPDGRVLAFLAARAGEPPMVWLQRLDGTPARLLDGTAGVSAAFWSPDGRFLAFFTNEALKRIDVSNGSAFTICSCSSDYNGTWNDSGVILFQQGSVITRVEARSGTPSPVSTLDAAAGETRHGHPVFLADGRRFLFTAFRGLQPRGVYLGALDAPAPKLLIEGAANAAIAGDFVVFVKGTALMAQRLDTSGPTLVGDAVPIIDEIRLLPDGTSGFTTSANGVLVHPGRSSGSDRRYEWRDRGGNRLGSVGPAGDYWDAHLTRDGRYLSVSLGTSAADRELWIIDTDRAIRTPFTDDSGTAQAQAWSTDGSRMAYMSTRGGKFDLYEKNVTTGEELLLLEGGRQKFVHDWSPDDRFVIYSTSESGNVDLWVLPTIGERKPVPFQQTRFNEHYAQFSPDGRWVAFQSEESGNWEVFVAPFPGPGRRVPISKGGGFQPRWRDDGKELFYWTTTHLMAVGVNTTGASFVADVPTPLFEMSPQWAGRWRYDVAANGQRFLVGEQETDGPPLASIIVNWPQLLENRAR